MLTENNSISTEDNSSRGLRFRWSDGVTQRTLDNELMDLGTKPRYVGIAIEATLDRAQIVAL